MTARVSKAGVRIPEPALLVLDNERGHRSRHFRAAIT